MREFRGIYFKAEPGGARIRISKRIDLVVDRLNHWSTDDLAAIETKTRDLALKLRRVLERAFVGSGSGGLFTLAQVDDAIGRCRRYGFTCHLRGENDKGKPATWRQPIIERRRVQDPMMSRAELLHQIEQFPDARWVGYTRADVNLSELIGGLSRIRRRTEAQTQGAAAFRNAAEQAQIGGAKAIDYGAVKVDSSGPTGDSVTEKSERARKQYQDAIERLGDVAPIAERIIVQGFTVSEAAQWLGLGSGGAARQKLTSAVLAAADELAEQFGYAGDRKSRASITAWSNGKAVIIRDDNPPAD